MVAIGVFIVTYPRVIEKLLAEAINAAEPAACGRTTSLTANHVRTDVCMVSVADAKVLHRRFESVIDSMFVVNCVLFKLTPKYDAADGAILNEIV